MKGLFISLTTIVMVFFIVRTGLSIWFNLKKDNYYKNNLIKALNDYGIVAYIVLLFAFSISLYLANDYTMAEVNFTLIILAIATVLFAGEKVYYTIKNKGRFYAQSNIYDLGALVNNDKFIGVLTKLGKNEFIIEDIEKFNQLIAETTQVDSKKLLKKRLINLITINGLSIILSITILVIGLVRCV